MVRDTMENSDVGVMWICVESRMITIIFILIRLLIILPLSSRNEIVSGTTSFGETYIIQDLVEEGYGTRQLVFTSNLRAVQSEVGFNVSGGKKKKKVFLHK